MKRRDSASFTFKLAKGITHSSGLGFDPAQILKLMGAVSEWKRKTVCSCSFP
ncbi:hypothetical protein D3C87_1071790 [compost metagenome]